jgi:hypothetical protein
MNGEKKNFCVGEYVLINNKYIGEIYKIVWNSNGYIVRLENDDKYEDKTLKQYKLIDFDNTRGYMLLTLNDTIIKIDEKNINILLELFGELIFKNVSKKIFKNSNVELNVEKNKEQEYGNIFKPEKFDIYRIQAGQEDDYIKYIEKMINDLFISDTQIRWEENFYFASSNYIDEIKSIDVLGEENIEDVIKPSLIVVLEKFNEIEQEQYYDFKSTLMYKHLIYDENIDTISMGKELIGMIKNTLLSIQKLIEFDDGEKLLSNTNLFDFLNFRIVGGYIEITNNNIEENFRVITEELVPELTELKFQYSKPIDYNILLPIVLDNKTPNDIIINKSLIEETLRILAQEYIICFQPDVDVLLWTIARIILSWYSDTKLYSNIFKIKILINLFRARGNKDFNKDQGILPIIQIFPKYGKKNALQVLSHLSYFFFPYKKLGLELSEPTWFDKIDNLMYYTNGSLEVKKYIKYLLNTDKKFLNPLTVNMEQINTPFIDNNIQYTIKKN